MRERHFVQSQPMQRPTADCFDRGYGPQVGICDPGHEESLIVPAPQCAYQLAREYTHHTGALQLALDAHDDQARVSDVGTAPNKRKQRPQANATTELLEQDVEVGDCDHEPAGHTPDLHYQADLRVHQASIGIDLKVELIPGDRNEVRIVVEAVVEQLAQRLDLARPVVEIGGSDLQPGVPNQLPVAIREHGIRVNRRKVVDYVGRMRERWPQSSSFE